MPLHRLFSSTLPASMLHTTPLRLLLLCCPPAGFPQSASPSLSAVHPNTA